MSRELTRLGDALERAAAAESRRRLRRPSRRLVIALGVVAVAVPTAAVGAVKLLGGDQVARTMPLGAAIFSGTHPTCTVVVAGVEYHCVLDRKPRPEVQDFTGAKEPTVDSTRHVNGGCVGLSADGLVWQCYVGPAAVAHDIVTRDFLGEYAPTPGAG